MFCFCVLVSRLALHTPPKTHRPSVSLPRLPRPTAVIRASISFSIALARSHVTPQNGPLLHHSGEPGELFVGDVEAARSVFALPFTLILTGEPGGR
jgi:hypothetical protein